MRVMVLLHYYEGNEFLGQTFTAVDVPSTDLKDFVESVYPGTATNITGTAGSCRSVEPPLLPLKNGYSNITNVRVMQIIPEKLF